MKSLQNWESWQPNDLKYHLGRFVSVSVPNGCLVKESKMQAYKKGVLLRQNIISQKKKRTT